MTEAGDPALDRDTEMQIRAENEIAYRESQAVPDLPADLAARVRFGVSCMDAFQRGEGSEYRDQAEYTFDALARELAAARAGRACSDEAYEETCVALERYRAERDRLAAALRFAAQENANCECSHCREARAALAALDVKEKTS